MPIPRDATRTLALGSIILDELGDDLRSATFMGSPWARLVTLATPRQVQAGEWLFREGDEPESMYVVISGRLEVLVEHPEPMVVRVLGRGEAVGELSLITGARNSASVRASRDTYLLKVSREVFEQLLTEDSDFALAVTRLLGTQLQETTTPALVFDPLPHTLALIGLSPELDVRGFGAELAATMREHESVAELEEADAETAGSEAAFGALLNHAEHDNARVLTLAGHPGDGLAWTDFALRTGDRVLALADGIKPPPQGKLDPRLCRCELLLLTNGSRPAHLERWIDAVDPRAVHVIPRGADGRRAVERLARRLAGRSVGVVLSGGGARGFAHIGVVEELLASGLEIDRLGGCSMGGLVAANFAMGRSADEVVQRCRDGFIDFKPLGDYTLPVAALVRGQRVIHGIKRMFGDARIEELERDFFCISCDLFDARLAVHRRGPVWEAVLAGMTLPAVMPPLDVGGRLMIDGGVLDNLPVGEMASRGEGPVIAVDVTAQAAEPEAEQRATPRRGAALRQRVRALITGSDRPLPKLKETLVRSMTLGSVDPFEAVEEHADLVIRPNTHGVPLTAWKRLDEMREAGRRAAREALERAPAVLKRR